MSDETGSIGDLIPDHANANRGTERGSGVLAESLQRLGAGRSIVIDRNNRIVAGNKTIEAAGEVGIDRVRIIETDGTEIIAVRRKDFDLSDPGGAARQYATADNRVSELSYDPDPAAFETMLREGVDLSWMYFEQELDHLTERIPDLDELERRWGTPEDHELWPAISVRVPHALKARFEDLMEEEEGEPHERLAALLDRLT